MRVYTLVFSMVVLPLCHSVLAADISEGIQLQARGAIVWSANEAPEGGMRPWFEQGAGQLNMRSTSVYLAPQSFAVTTDLTDSISGRLNAEYHHASETGTDITETWLNWQPLPWDNYRVKLRAGWFYPALSLENTDTAWTSPYTNNFSFINSWFAEELRANAVEASVSRKVSIGSAPLTLEWVGALARGNDPLGSLISWRGFAIHNLQTGLHERIQFADYPSLQQAPLTLQPNWVEPFLEVDGRTGFYTGLHALYNDATELRLYRYDNRADPTVVRYEQYAWHTRFSHFALQHQFNDEIRLVTQWLDGDTQMGDKAVYVDYQAWFALVNYSTGNWQLSWRYDRAKQRDEDDSLIDNNTGNARSWTANVSYRLSEHWQIAAEFTELSSTQANRAQWPRWPVDHSEQLGSVVLSWRID